MSKYGYFLIGPEPSLEKTLNQYSTERLLEEVKRYKEFKKTSEVTLQNPNSLCYIHAKRWPRETSEIFEVYNSITRILAERFLDQQSLNS